MKMNLDAPLRDNLEFCEIEFERLALGDGTTIWVETKIKGDSPYARMTKAFVDAITSPNEVIPLWGIIHVADTLWQVMGIGCPDGDGNPTEDIVCRYVEDWAGFSFIDTHEDELLTIRDYHGFFSDTQGIFRHYWWAYDKYGHRVKSISEYNLTKFVFEESKMRRTREQIDNIKKIRNINATFGSGLATDEGRKQWTKGQWKTVINPLNP